MIFRVSAKFQRHFRLAVDKAERPVQPFPYTWNLDLLPHGKSQILVLASEEHSLFSFLVPLARSNGYQSFVLAFQSRLTVWKENIRLFDDYAPPEFVDLQLTRRTARRVIGTQNEFLFAAKHMLAHFEQSASLQRLEKIEREINALPMSYLGMDSPEQAAWKQKRARIIRPASERHPFRRT